MSTKLQKKQSPQKQIINKNENNNLPLEITDAEKDYILTHLNQFPYRGALTHIAKQRNVTRNAIFISLRKHNNKAYLAMIKEYGDKNYSNIRNAS